MFEISVALCSKKDIRADSKLRRRIEAGSGSFHGAQSAAASLAIVRLCLSTGSGRTDLVAGLDIVKSQGISGRTVLLKQHARNA